MTRKFSLVKGWWAAPYEFDQQLKWAEAIAQFVAPNEPDKAPDLIKLFTLILKYPEADQKFVVGKVEHFLGLGIDPASIYGLLPPAPCRTNPASYPLFYRQLGEAIAQMMEGDRND